MKRTTGNNSFWLFLLGLGSCTQVYIYGCIAISELISFFIAPILFVRNYKDMRRLGFYKFSNMVMLVFMSFVISSCYNHTAIPFAIKSFAVIYSVWAYFVVFYKLLIGNLNGLRWFFIGVFISSIITIYAFNPTAMVDESGFGYMGNADMEDIIKGQLFWTGKFKMLSQIPICGYYLRFPLVLSILVPMIYLGVALATTVSGRASSVALLISGVMIVIGRKKRTSMTTIGKHFFSYLFLGIIAVFAIKQVYVLAAKNGFLSEEAQAKYERQSKQGNSLIKLLMQGRTGFFSAIPAVLDRPLVGYGPSAEDIGGYAKRFILKYGDDEDMAIYLRSEQKVMQLGYRMSLPTHSYIMGAWVHYGIGGFLFYIWVLHLIYCHIKRYAAAIPQWYGYFAMMLPYYLWNIFFSPFGFRWQFALLMACLFFSKAIGDGLMPLPNEMIKEIYEHEK